METVLEGYVSTRYAVCYNQSGAQHRNGMDGGQFGFQSANAVIFFVVIVAISLFQMGIMNKKEEQL